MNKEDIVKLALEAGFGCDTDGHLFTYNRDGICDEYLERFAALVAAAERQRLEATAWGASKKWIVEAVTAEREACAKAAEDMCEYGKPYSAAAAIRARGDHEV